MLNILYATDGSRGALGAARFLSGLPRQEQVELNLLTVRPPDEQGSDDGEGENILAEARSALEGFRGDIRTSIRYVENRTPAIVETIVNTARAGAVDMIVLGTCGRSALSRFFVGSVAEGIAHEAPCPVLLASPLVGPALDSVVMGFDGSTDAVAAAEWLPHLPVSEDCVLHLLSVVLPHPTFTGGAGLLLLASGVDVDTLVDRDKARITTAQEAMAAKLKEYGIFAHVVREVREDLDAGAALVGAARGCRADLIVVGSKGTTGMEQVLLGSVSQHVLHNAPCSVLIVRSRADG